VIRKTSFKIIKIGIEKMIVDSLGQGEKLGSILKTKRKSGSLYPRSR
jgi:hypothetical protein